MNSKLFKDSRLAIFTDGGSRGNPRPSLAFAHSLKPSGFSFASWRIRLGKTPVFPTPFPVRDYY